MARKVAVADTILDPTLPKTPITIDGKTYNLCLDLGALAEAEAALIAEGHDVNLLVALPNPNLHNTRIVFAAALRKFHPEISFTDAQRLVRLPHLYQVAQAVTDSWTASTPEATEKSDPPQPGE